MCPHSLPRRGLLVGLLGTTALTLAACVGSGSSPPTTAAVTPAEARPEAPGDGQSLGQGSVKVALLLPLSSGGQGATAAAAMRNAAELALAEFQNPDLTVLVKDDRGTPDGAREAATQALAEGAELIIGPLFAATVQAAAQVVRQAGKPMIAFSTDASVAARGVYLLSFLPQPEVDRVVDHAADQGRRSFAALIPETTYGSVVEAQFREATARRGLRVVAIERYPAGKPQEAVGRIAGLIGGPTPQADALFLPDSADGLPAIGQALTQAGFSPQKVKPLGAGVWNDRRVFRIPALQGGWFAAPDMSGFNAFAERYRGRFGTDPTRLATLAYDAVFLAAALNRQYGSQRFEAANIASPAGFAGVDGVFRFKADGTNDRALAVLEIRNGGAVTVSPAPRSFGSSGT